MTALARTDQADMQLTNEVTAHLAAQLESARRLLAVVLEQGGAIRRRDVETVVRTAGAVQVELQRRQLLDADRSRLLERAAAQLGVAPGAVTLTLLEGLMNEPGIELARARSAELRGLLEEVQREHRVNRALMSQELAFLDHLLRLADGASDAGYDAAGDRVPSSAGKTARPHRVLDLEV